METPLNGSGATTEPAYFRKALYAHSAGGEIAPHEQDNDARIRAYIISKNIHRRHLTAEQKRNLLVELVKASPEKSNRQIAKTAKVDDKTVGAVRRELESTAEIPQLEKTVGADGKARKQRKQRDPKKERRAREVRKLQARDGLPPAEEIMAADDEKLSEIFTATSIIDRLREQLRAAEIKIVGLEAKTPKNIEADSEGDIESEIEPEEFEVLDLVEEVLDGEPLTAKQAATFEKIKKRLKRRARDFDKREAQNKEVLNEYKTTLGSFVARLIAAGVARDLWLALTVRGPCGGKEGYAFWLVPPLVEAIEEALERGPGIEKAEPELVPAVEPITTDDDCSVYVGRDPEWDAACDALEAKQVKPGLDDGIPDCLRRAAPGANGGAS
jgi:hypothetical protein